MNLRILARCKEYRHTEKSRSIQEVRGVRGLRRILDVRGDHEVRQSLKGREGLSGFLLVDQGALAALSVRLLTLLGRLSLLQDLSLPAGRVNLDFLGNRSFLWGPALRGVPACLGIREAPEGRGYCCGTCRWGSGSVTC